MLNTPQVIRFRSFRIYNLCKSSYSVQDSKPLLLRGRVSVAADVRYNRVKGYSRKYTTGYTAKTRDKHDIGVKRVKLSLCLTNLALRHEDV
jgi:hypothetical protein